VNDLEPESKVESVAPTRSPPDDFAIFEEKAPRMAWISGGVMLLNLFLILCGFALRAIGLWNDLTGSILGVISFALFAVSVILIQIAFYRQIRRRRRKMPN
jgi:hypothetical protein